MKLTIIGCTLLVCSTLLYGFRYITAAILDAGNNALGQGLVGIDRALSWLGWAPTLLMLASFVLGILCLVISFRVAD